MNKFLKGLKGRDNFTVTENGAVAYKSTLNACLDAFATLGAMKKANASDIISTFEKAFLEDEITAMRVLFYIRDVRGGQGARRVFRTALRWLAENYPEYVIRNLTNIMEYGRGDDFLCLLDTKIKGNVIAVINAQLTQDVKNLKEGHIEDISLLAKWLPSENASSADTCAKGAIIRKGLGCTPKFYRQMLTKLRGTLNVVEAKISRKKWDEVNYEAVPAKAAIKYTNAFIRNDEDRYVQYLSDLSKGKAKVNANVLYPVDIVRKAQRGSNKTERVLADAMWKALPNYFGESVESAICMVDTSGSMDGEPYEVAVSLGLYCADKCKGPFKNHFITFAEKPSLVEVKGQTLYEKLNGLRCINAGNTDLEAAFNLILNTAIENHCTPDEVPQKLYIISDMQFDQARGEVGYYWERRNPPKPFMQKMREKFEANGYKFPTIVYWNVRASDAGMFQQTFEGEDCCMVSGYSPSLFKSILEGTVYKIEVNARGEVKAKAVVDPMIVMYTTVYNERYDKVYPQKI